VLSLKDRMMRYKVKKMANPLIRDVAQWLYHGLPYFLNIIHVYDEGVSVILCAFLTEV
jgi:hypothetical protein